MRALTLMQTTSGTVVERPSRGEVDLTEAALAEQPFDAVPQARFGALDDLADRQQVAAIVRAALDPARRCESSPRLRSSFLTARGAGLEPRLI